MATFSLSNFMLTHMGISPVKATFMTKFIAANTFNMITALRFKYYCLASLANRTSNR